MNIAIFQEVTTEEALISLETEAATYENLYVEMDQPEQRKFVKDKASQIFGMLKKLDRVRIDKSRDFKVQVELEAGLIKERLEGANKPFTLLIDEYKIVREKELAAKKAREDAKALALQIPVDHEDALLMNKMHDFEKAEAVREQAERDQAIAAEAVEAERLNAAAAIEAEKANAERLALEAKQTEARLKAEIEENQRAADLRQQLALEQAEKDKQFAIDEERRRQTEQEAREQAEIVKREANKQHAKMINNEALQCFIDGGLSDADAKQAVKLIAHKMISHVVINY